MRFPSHCVRFSNTQADGSQRLLDVQIQDELSEKRQEQRSQSCESAKVVVTCHVDVEKSTVIQVCETDAVAREPAPARKAPVQDSETSPRSSARPASETPDAKNAAECHASDSVGELLTRDQEDRLVVVWRRSDMYF